jgi:hypothetical protein
MPWVQIGEEVPTKDENGRRTPADGEGNTRPVEFVPYEPLSGIEVNVNDMASVADRRWFDSTMSNLVRSRPFSTVLAADYEDVFLQICARFVKSTRHKDSGKEMEGKEAHEFLKDALDWDDVFALLATVRRQVEMSKSKKKSLNSWFGLPTESPTKE